MRLSWLSLDLDGAFFSFAALRLFFALIYLFISNIRFWPFGQSHLLWFRYGRSQLTWKIILLPTATLKPSCWAFLLLPFSPFLIFEFFVQTFAFITSLLQIWQVIIWRICIRLHWCIQKKQKRIIALTYLTLVSSSIILAFVKANVMLGLTNVLVIHISTT